MLLKLFCQLSAQNLKILLCLTRALSKFYNLLVNVAAKECSAFCRLLLGIFDLFEDLFDVAVFLLFDLLDLAHNIFDEILDENFCLFIAV